MLSGTLATFGGSQPWRDGKCRTPVAVFNPPLPLRPHPHTAPPLSWEPYELMADLGGAPGGCSAQTRAQRTSGRLLTAKSILYTDRNIFIDILL